MAEKLYGGIPRYGKAYFAEMFNEMYYNMIKKALNATIHVVDEYIRFWDNNENQEFYYDVSPLEVLEELKKTLLTGEYPIRMNGDLND